MAANENGAFKALTYDFRDAWAPQDSMSEQVLNHLYPMNLEPTHSQPIASNIGALHNLPFETLFQILEQISIPTLINFRNSNRFARFIVDSIPAFRRILQFAPHTVRGLLAIQTTTHIDVIFLYQKLEQKHCDNCRNLAQHFWLPTASRLCYACFCRYRMLLTADEVLATFPLDEDDLVLLPHSRSIPCIFSAFTAIGQQVKGRQLLYDVSAAVKAAFERRGWNRLPFLVDLRRDSLSVKHGLQSQRDSRATIKMESPPLYLRRSLAATVAPWLSTNGAEYGVLCSTCFYTQDKDVLYSKDDFHEHLKMCRIQPVNMRHLEETSDKTSEIAIWPILIESSAQSGRL